MILPPDALGDDGRSFAELRSSGMLWLINRTVFHPRGFALAFHVDDGSSEPTGWSLMGDGTEPFQFTDGDDDRLFALAEAFLDLHRPKETDA